MITGLRPEPRPGGSASWTSAKDSGPWNPLMGLFSGEGLHGPCEVAVGPPLRTNPIERLQRAQPFAGDRAAKSGPMGATPLAGFRAEPCPSPRLRRLRENACRHNLHPAKNPPARQRRRPTRPAIRAGGAQRTDKELRMSDKRTVTITLDGTNKKSVI